jgi:type II secretory pathway pseudopilin PulG
MKPRRPGRSPESGLTIIEVLVSATVFTLVSGAIVTTLVMSSALNSTNRETVLAAQAAQSAIEQLKVADFAEVFARYNATAADDPVAGVSPGRAFEVRGLSALAGDADGLVGVIEFPGDGLVLREDSVDAELGLPRDLNGDAAVDAADHAADYRILPVRAVVEWRGKTGDRRLELVTVLSEP